MVRIRLQNLLHCGLWCQVQDFSFSIDHSHWVYPTHEVVKSLHPDHGKPHGPHNRSSKWSSPSLAGYVIDRSIFFHSLWAPPPPPPPPPPRLTATLLYVLRELGIKNLHQLEKTSINSQKTYTNSKKTYIDSGKTYVNWKKNLHHQLRKSYVNWKKATSTSWVKTHDVNWIKNLHQRPRQPPPPPLTKDELSLVYQCNPHELEEELEMTRRDHCRSLHQLPHTTSVSDCSNNQTSLQTFFLSFFLASSSLVAAAAKQQFFFLLTRKKKLEEEEEERNPAQNEERKNPKQKRSNKHKSPTHTQQKQVYISRCMRVAKLTKS